MVYRTYRRKRYGTYRKRRTGFKRRSLYARRMRKSFIPKPEYKVQDAIASMNHDSANPDLVLVNGMVRGTNDDERVGHRVIIKSIQCSGTTFNGSSGVDQITRLALVWDRAPTGVLPTLSDIWVNGGTQDHVNLDNTHRFKVLWDRQVSINTKGAYGDTKIIKFYKKMNKVVTFNNGNVGDITDFSKGALYLASIGNVTGANVYATSSVTTRIRYIDY